MKDQKFRGTVQKPKNHHQKLERIKSDLTWRANSFIFSHLRHKVWRKVVNFTKILRAAILYESVLQSFYLLTIWVCYFLVKENVKCKMLGTLCDAPLWQFHQHFTSSFFKRKCFAQPLMVPGHSAADK